MGTERENSKSNKRQVGNIYEQKAVEYLEEHGYSVLERNYQNQQGEIDIIAKKDGVLVAVEVKFREGKAYGDPLEAVNVRKQRRICRAMLSYYMVRSYEMDTSCRFDVIGIYGDGTIKHVENAFEYLG